MTAVRWLILLLAPILTLSCSSGHKAAAMEDDAGGRAAIHVIAYDPGDYRTQLSPEWNTVVKACYHGYVSVSDDPLFGGPPFRTFRVPKSDVVRLAEELTPIFEKTDRQDFTASHSPSSRIVLISPAGKRFEMVSEHEFSEADGSAVATQDGLFGVDEDTNAEVIESRSPEYVEFRKDWETVRSRLASLETGDER